MPAISREKVAVSRVPPVLRDVGLAFWQLLPANPIVVRVVQMAGKRVQHLWLRVGYLLALFFVLLFAQLSMATPQAGSSLGELAKNSSQVFYYISLLQLGMICLLAPVFTASAISQEKDAETFNVLLTTPLTNAQIVLGSLLSRLFFVVVLLISGLPIFCITMLYGGVTTDQIFQSFGIAACTALLTGALAIFISVVRIGTRTTVFSFYALIGIYLLAGALGLWSRTYVPESIPVGSQVGMTWLAPFHPVWALLVALKTVKPPEAPMVAGYMWPINHMLSAPHTAYMVMTFLVSTAIIAFSTIFVRRGIKQGELSWWAKYFSARKNNDEESNEKRRRVYRVWSNPVAWREAMIKGSPANSRAACYGFILIFSVAGLFLLYQYAQGRLTVLEARQWLSGLVIVEFIIVMLMGVNTAAMAINRERESGTMELLLTTPLTSRYIILGKLRGLVSFTIPLLAVPAGTVLLAAIYELLKGRSNALAYLDCALLLPILLVVYSAFACMLGLYMSLRCTRSIQAVLTSVGILLAVAFGLGLCGYGFLSNAGETAALFTPITMVPSIVALINPGAMATSSIWANGAPTVTTRWLLVLGVVAAGVLYGVVVAGLYRTTLREFDMTLRKQFK